MFLRYSISFYLNLNKHYPKKGGYPIVCRLRAERKKAEFHTDRWCELKDWDEKYEQSRTDKKLSNYLSYIKSEIENIHYHLLRDHKEMSAKILRSEFLGDSEKNKLTEAFDKNIRKIKKLKEEYSSGTIGMYRTTLDHLSDYLKKIRKTDLPVQGFTRQHVEDFEYYLKVDKSMGINTATKYLKKLSAFYNRAVRMDMLDESPFEDYRFKQKKTHKTFLTIPDIELIQQLGDLPDHIKIARNIFVFAIYTGLRYSDILNLKNSNIEKDDQGYEWIRIIMQKTNDYLRIPLIKPAKTILRIYKKEREASGRPLPKMAEARYNLYLKDIAIRAGIDKKLTSHVARHTFATSVRIKYGIPIEVTSKLLGHRKLASTMVYSQITDDEVLRYMRD